MKPLRLTSPLNNQVVSHGVRSQYCFERGEWTEVSNETDALSMLSSRTGQGQCLQAEVELGPIWLRGTKQFIAKAHRNHYRQDAYLLQPDRLTPLPRWQAYQLQRHRHVRLVGASRFLDTVPSARIVVVRDAGLGDVLFVGATVDRLREEYPDATIDYVTLSQFCGVVGGITLWEALDRAPYDALFNYQFALETHRKKLELDRIALAAEIAELQDDAWPMRAEVTKRNLDFGKQARGKVGLALTGSNVWRHGGHAWRQRIANGLKGYDLFAVGNSGEKYPKHVESFVNKTTIGQLAGLLSHAAAVISVDTGALYLAQARGTPVVGLFGPIDYRQRLRLGPKASVVQAPACGPCDLDGDNGQCKPPLRCFESITPAMVRKALEAVHGGSPGK